MADERVHLDDEKQKQENIQRLMQALAPQISTFLSVVGAAPGLGKYAELAGLLHQVAVVMRQAFPSPVNPFPPTGSGTMKCPHCGKDIP